MCGLDPVCLLSFSRLREGTCRALSRTNVPPRPTADVYSFAVTAWELLTRRIPFMEFDPIEALSLVADDTLEPPFRPEIPELCPPALARLITECWHQTPARRPAFTEIADRLREMPRTDLQGLMGETQTVLREGRASEGGQYAGLPEDIRAALTSKGDAAFEKALDRVTLVFTDIVGEQALGAGDVAWGRMVERMRWSPVQRDGVFAGLESATCIVGCCDGGQHHGSWPGLAADCT